MTGVVAALVAETDGRLMGQLAARCDREGLDYTLVRQADSRGAQHIVTVTNWRSGERISIHAGTLAEVLALVLDELDRKDMA